MKLSFLKEQTDYFRQYPKVVFPANTPIFHQGDLVQYVYYIEQGAYSRTAVTANGEVLVYETNRSDDTVTSLIGVMYYYSPVKKTSFQFVALEECICYRMTFDQCISCLGRYPAYLEELLRVMMQRYYELNQNMLAKVSKTTPNIICLYLLENAVQNDGILYIPKELNNSELGRRLGIHRVTVSKILSALEKEKIIRRTSCGREILDSNRLLSYANREQNLLYK